MLRYKVPAWQQLWALKSSLLQSSPLLSASPEGQGLQEVIEPLLKSLLKSWGEKAKVVFASCLQLPSVCCQYWLRNRFPLRLGWLSPLVGFSLDQLGSQLVWPWLFLLERASVSAASWIKSLLQELLDPNTFLGSARSRLITRSFHPKPCWGCRKDVELPFSLLLVGCLLCYCFSSNPDEEIPSAPFKSSPCSYQEPPEISGIVKNLTRLASLMVCSVCWVSSRSDANCFLLVRLLALRPPGLGFSLTALVTRQL